MLIKRELLQLSSDIAIRFASLERSGKIFNVNLRKKSGKLYARFFTDGKNYIFYKIDNKEWTRRNQLVYGLQDLPKDKTQLTEIKKFMFPAIDERDWNWRHIDTVEECITEFTSQIHRNKHYRDYLNKKALQEQHFAMFPDLPADFEDWCCHNLFDDKQYLFFEKKSKKGIRRIMCSSCGASYETADANIRHKASGVCEKCGHLAMYVAKHYAGSRKDKRKACICSQQGDAYLFETREVYQTYTGIRAKYIAVPIERILYWPKAEKRKIYKYSYKNIMHYGLDWYRAINELPTIKGMVYDRDLLDILPGRFGAELEKVLKEYRVDICVPRLVINLELIPQTEYLFKMGMMQLAAEADRLQFGDGNNFSGAMGVNSVYRELYKQLDITTEEHYFIKKYEGLIKPENMLKLRAYRVTETKYLARLKNKYGIGVEKALRYMEKIWAEKSSMNFCLMTWSDYLGMADELKFDMKNVSVLFPNGLKDAHDRLVAMINEQKLAEKSAKYEREAKEFAEHSGFFLEMAKKCQTKEYVMRIAQTRYDLTKEGTELHHCVGSDMYWQRHIKGESLICFIRKRGQEDVPYFTCEIALNNFNGYHISQLYGKKDCKPNAEIRAFAEKFLRMIKPIKQKII